MTHPILTLCMVTGILNQHSSQPSFFLFDVLVYINSHFLLFKVNQGQLHISYKLNSSTLQVRIFDMSQVFHYNSSICMKLLSLK